MTHAIPTSEDIIVMNRQNKTSDTGNYQRPKKENTCRSDRLNEAQEVYSENARSTKKRKN
jgi:hypothetical protein